MEKQPVLEKTLTIQQMAEATGLSAHTLRYYERAGLMRQEVGRDNVSGYRSYTQQHIAWVEFIKRLRATGMPIRDIQHYTELLRQGEQTIPARMHLLQQHQSRVEEHLREVENYLAAIVEKIAYYEEEAARHFIAGCGEGAESYNPD